MDKTYRVPLSNPGLEELFTVFANAKTLTSVRMRAVIKGTFPRYHLLDRENNYFLLQFVNQLLINCPLSIDRLLDRLTVLLRVLTYECILSPGYAFK